MFSQKRSYQNKKLYTKKRNFCLKKKHYANLNHKGIADSKQFWWTVKALLCDKSKSNEKMTLVEDNKMKSEDKINEELLNSFSSNVVKNLTIPEISYSNPLV